MFQPLLNMFSAILSAVLSVVAVAMSLLFAIVAWRVARRVLFGMDFIEDSRFEKFYQLNEDDFSSRDEAKKEYLYYVKLETEFKIHHRRELKRERFNERRDAYRYMQALDRYNFEHTSNDNILDDELDNVF